MFIIYENHVFSLICGIYQLAFMAFSLFLYGSIFSLLEDYFYGSH